VAVANGKKDVARTEKVVRVMFSPGTEVSGTGWRATVHPMGIRHVQRAMLLLAGSPQLAKTLAELKPDSAPADLASIAVQALPLLARDGLDLVAECTAFAEPEGASIESVPHWELPAIITASEERAPQEPKLPKERPTTYGDVDEMRLEESA